jgi:hypothetical protein
VIRRRVVLVAAAIIGCMVVACQASATDGPLAAVTGTADPHDLDLSRLVARGGVIDHVWFVPAGRARAQLVVAWQRGSVRGTPTRGYVDNRRYHLTLWDPQKTALDWQRKWMPHALVTDSPFPISDYSGRSAVRLADVTGDGHADLLVTIGCAGCNHGVSAVSVVATLGSHVQRIYGRGFMTTKDPQAGVHGRVLVESRWGARRGLLWFDLPYRSYFSGVRVVTFLRWTHNRWRTVSTRKLTEQQVRRLHLHQ